LCCVAQEDNGQQLLDFIEADRKGGKRITGYEYAVLVTNLDHEIPSLGQHYRDRADAENAFDWLSRRAYREPVKKGRDRAQSVLVAELLLADLPGMPFDPGRLRYFSADMLATARRTIEAIPTSSSPPGVLNLPVRASRGAYLRAHNTGKPPPAQRPRGGRSTLAVDATGTPE
jgi:hypothetical protein